MGSEPPLGEVSAHSSWYCSKCHPRTVRECATLSMGMGSLCLLRSKGEWVPSRVSMAKSDALGEKARGRRKERVLSFRATRATHAPSKTQKPRASRKPALRPVHTSPSSDPPRELVYEKRHAELSGSFLRMKICPRLKSPTCSGLLRKCTCSKAAVFLMHGATD
jgi:hypothetical protein